MSNITEIIFNVDFIFSTLRIMTPILFAGLASMIFFKGGIDAIGVEGIMLITSLIGVLGGYFTSNFYLGVLIGMTAGSLLGVLYVYITNVQKADEILTGIAINTFATGGTVSILYYITGEKGSTQSLLTPMAPTIDIPIIKSIPIIGDMLSGHSLLTYLSILCVILLFVMLYKTSLGLRIIAVGENEKAAESVGINILKYRYIAGSIAGAMAGLGGVFLSMSYINGFSRGMVAGRGFMGMAAEGMGKGYPGGILLSSILLGAVDTLAVKLQTLNVPVRLVQALPYIITIVVVSSYSYIELKNKRKKE